MKKLLLLITTVLLGGTIAAQQSLPFFEDFEGSMAIPSEFTLINVDGNTPASAPAGLADSAFIVRYSDDMESQVAYGVSYYDPDAGADDWLILPQLSLTNNPMLTWKALSLTSSGDYPDTYQVLVSTTDAQTGSFTSLFEVEEAVSLASGGEGVQSRMLDLSDYAGQDVYIAFRLMTPSPGGDRLAIDDIRVDEMLMVGFEDGIPDSWNVTDGGDNPGTWYQDDYAPFEGDFNATIQTYDDNTNTVDDWMITNKLSVMEGYELSFYANTSSSSYPDALYIYASKTGTGAAAFNITVAEIEALNTDWTKYSYVLSDVAGIASGDEVYIGFYTDVIGDYLGVDEVYYGPVLEPKMVRAIAHSDDAVMVYFDAELENAPAAGDFTLTGTAEVTFSDAQLDPDDASIVHLSGASTAMAGDNTVDDLTYSDATYAFYAGITPFAYTSLTNTGGTLNYDAEYATFKGIVMAINDDTSRVWFADAAGAHNGVNTYDLVIDDVNVGDEVLFYGKLSPYSGQTEIYPATALEVVSSGNTLFDATVISGADIANTIAEDEDPAEQYEGVLVKVEGAEVTNWDGAFFTLTDDGGATSFYVGDWFIFPDGIDETTMEVGTTYDITGLVIGRDGEFRIAPRNADDIIVSTSSELRNILEALSIYPVPVVDMLHMDNISPFRTVELMNANGQVILRHEVDAKNNLTIDMSAYESGMYILKLEMEGAAPVIRKITR